MPLDEELKISNLFYKNVEELENKYSYRDVIPRILGTEGYAAFKELEEAVANSYLKGDIELPNKIENPSENRDFIMFMAAVETGYIKDIVRLEEAEEDSGEYVEINTFISHYVFLYEEVFKRMFGKGTIKYVACREHGNENKLEGYSREMKKYFNKKINIQSNDHKNNSFVYLL